MSLNQPSVKDPRLATENVTDRLWVLVRYGTWEERAEAVQHPACPHSALVYLTQEAVPDGQHLPAVVQAHAWFRLSHRRSARP